MTYKDWMVQVFKQRVKISKLIYVQPVFDGLEVSIKNSEIKGKQNEND